MLSDVAHFRAFGYVVLRRTFDAEALRREVDQALESAGAASIDTERARVRYVPMMGERTPVSLSLLDRFQPIAATLLGRPVVPLRAKGMRYSGNTDAHRDSELAMESVGFAAYLEPLREDTGALRLLPGSHRDGFERGTAGYLAVPTDPGDVIVFDEHLFHASAGGTIRTQWRVDYFAAPRSAEEVEVARRYVANVFPPGWDGGYDVDRHPSYPDEWLRSGRPAVEQLRALGVYDLARIQEEFARRGSRNTLGRPSPPPRDAADVSVGGSRFAGDPTGT